MFKISVMIFVFVLFFTLNCICVHFILSTPGGAARPGPLICLSDKVTGAI